MQKKCNINANKMTPNPRNAKTMRTNCNKKCEINDNRAGKNHVFGLSRSAPDPGTCAWMTKRQENYKKMTNK